MTPGWTYLGDQRLADSSLYIMHAMWFTHDGTHAGHITAYVTTGPFNAGVDSNMIKNASSAGAPIIMGVSCVGNAYPPSATGNNWLKVEWNNTTASGVRASLTLTKIGGGYQY
jgi:hypothetical protein